MFSKNDLQFDIGDIIVLSDVGIRSFKEEEGIQMDEKLKRQLKNKIFEVKNFSSIGDFIFIKEIGINGTVKPVFRKDYRLPTQEEIKVYQIKNKIFKK